MLNKSLFSLLLIMQLCTTVFANTIKINAKYVYMVDVDTGFVMIDKRSDEAMYPSSMSKLMTLYVAFMHITNGTVSIDDEFMISKQAYRAEGSTMFLKLGQSVKLADLIKGVIVQSGNDASIAIAEGIAGTTESFVHQMNSVAKKIGLNDSHFTNVTGLPHKDHKMSAKDLAKLSLAIIKNYPEYYHYFAIKEFKYNNVNQPNRNILLGASGVDGLKTGHTKIAGYGMTASAKQKDRRIIAVINGSKSEKMRSQEMKKLIHHAYFNYKNIKLFKKNETVHEAKAWNCSKVTIKLIADQDILQTIEKMDNPEDIKIVLEHRSPFSCNSEANNEAKLIVEYKDQKAQYFLRPKKANSISWIGRIIQNAKHYIVS